MNFFFLFGAIKFVLAEGGHFRILVMVGGRIRVRKEEIDPESHGFHFSPWSVIQGGPWEAREEARGTTEQRKAKGDWRSAEPRWGQTQSLEFWRKVIISFYQGIALVFQSSMSLFWKNFIELSGLCFAHTQQWRPSATERKILPHSAERL